jgi:3-methyladenine DNA glycosylase/8-oxoguanine DNA glycosylase
VLDGREVRIEPAPGGVRVTPGSSELAGSVRRYLGEPFDLDSFGAFSATEPVLAEVVPALLGFRPPLVPNPFETLVTSITAQQISLRAAASIRNRLIEAFGERHEVAFAFPTRERLALARAEELVAVGFSRRKAEYAVGLAQSDVDLRALAFLPNDEVRSTLVALPGIGDWTAEWFLARHLGRPDAWPHGDLALRKAVQQFYGSGEDVRLLGARFSHFANLAAHYLLVGHRVYG